MVLILKYFGSEVMLPYFLLTLREFIAETLDLDEKGQTLIEYALILVLIAIAIFTTVLLVGEQVRDFYQKFIEEFPSL